MLEYTNCQIYMKDTCATVCADGKSRISLQLTRAAEEELRQLAPNENIYAECVYLDITDSGDLLVYGVDYNDHAEQYDTTLLYDGTNNGLLIYGVQRMLAADPVVVDGRCGTRYLGNIPDVVRFLIAESY